MMFNTFRLAAAAAMVQIAYSSQPSTYTPPTGYDGYISYSTVKGYFLQDETSTNATTFDYTKANFGLKNRTYSDLPSSSASLTQWQQFDKEIQKLNAKADKDTAYKVLFLGRHGEGYHNAAETYYGTPGWNCYWAELNGNSTVSWHDAALDAAGIAQAQTAHDFWAHELSVEKTPAPQSYYTSPLTRCLQTANVTFTRLNLPASAPFVPTVKEMLREGISIHTCDHRRSKSYIENLFPSWKIEKGFAEEDGLWNGVSAETTTAQADRSKKWLDEVFATDDSTYISITSHSGEIASTLAVLGHIEFSLNTGAIIPVLVKAQFLPKKDAPKPTAFDFTVITHCAAPPKTSVSTLSQGCICSGGKAVTTPLVKVTNTNTAGSTTYPGPNYR